MKAERYAYRFGYSLGRVLTVAGLAVALPFVLLYYVVRGACDAIGTALRGGGHE